MALCAPTVIYLGVSAITLISMGIKGVSVGSIFTNLLFMGIWAWILEYVCSSGHPIAAWVLLFLPLILLMVLLAFAAEIMRSVKK
jgi:hypothetical protein